MKIRLNVKSGSLQTGKCCLQTLANRKRTFSGKEAESARGSNREQQRVASRYSLSTGKWCGTQFSGRS